MTLVSTKGFQLVRFFGHRGEEPEFSFEHGGWSGQATLGQQSREHCVAAGVGIGASLPVGEFAYPGLPQGQVRRDPQVQRLLSLCRRQPHGTGRPYGTGDGAVGGVIEAQGPDVAGVTEAAERLVRDCRGGDQATTARAGHFSAGESGGDAVAGMPGFLRGVTIVEIQVANHHPVGEGR